MARRAIVLENYKNDTDILSHRVLMWIPVPADQQVANPEFTSEYPADLPNQLTEAELTELRNGTWKEQAARINIDKRNPDGSTRTNAQLKSAFNAAVEARYQFLVNSQAALKNVPDIYGSSYDDATGWTVVTG